MSMFGRYFFVYYECKSWGWSPDGTSTGSDTQKAQTLIDTHPLQWQLEVNKKYDKEREVAGGYKRRENYTVINWKEITLEEYKEFESKIG